MLWLSPIPIGLYTGRLHLTWGNLSFTPSAKPKILLHGGLLIAALLAALRWGVRTDPQRPYRWGASAALSTVAILLGATQFRSGVPLATWLPGSIMELSVLAVASGALYRITGSPVGPAVAASLVWMTRTAVITFATGAFEGIGMVVTTPGYERFCTVLWPLAWTLFLTWHTPLRPRT